MSHVLDAHRPLLVEIDEIAQELQRRAQQQRCLRDMRYVAELLYPPDNPDFNDFWKRFGEPQEWLLKLCLQWKARSTIEILPGFSIVLTGKEHKVRKREEFNLANYHTLLILQSRETLKTAIRRIDFIHDQAYWPMVMGSPCTSAWFAHKLEEAKRNADSIKNAMCASDEFFFTWDDVLVPHHRNVDKWNTAEYFNCPIHPASMPERSATFTAVKSRYEGGRYKSGHFDDLVTGDDRVSAATREEKKASLKDRENERDKTIGTRIVQGTYYHNDDAYHELQRQKGVLTLKMPCIERNYRKFFEFAAMDTDVRAKKAAEYTEICRPVFKHLDILTLAETCEAQTPRVFAGQMLLKPGLGGQAVFDTDKIMLIDLEDVPTGLPCNLFCDTAFKRPENRYKGDFNALGAILTDKHDRLIVVDGAYRNDWGESEVFHEAGRLIQGWNPMNFFMEQKFQGDIQPHWMDYAFANNLRITHIRGLEKAGVANKALRIQQLEPYFTSGRIVLVRGIPITEAILKEAGGYDRITGPASHDDALDMLAQALDPAAKRAGFGFGGRQDPAARAILEERSPWMP